jgi:hypothetical protein
MRIPRSRNPEATDRGQPIGSGTKSVKVAFLCVSRGQDRSEHMRMHETVTAQRAVEFRFGEMAIVPVGFMTQA